MDAIVIYNRSYVLSAVRENGKSGDELIMRFTEQRANIKRAVGMLINEADDIAKGKRKSVSTNRK